MAYCISQQVYWICHHVDQKLHLVVLHLPSSVLQRPSSNIRNNTRVLFRSLTWVYCICHQVYCRGHHLTSGTTTGVYFRSLTWVYCICDQVVCISYHVNQEPHMVSSEAYKSVKCTAEAIMYIRSLIWMYFISDQVYCWGHHVLQEPHFCVPHLPSSVLHRPLCTPLNSLGCTAIQ